MNDSNDDLIRRVRSLPREEPSAALREAVKRSARRVERSAGWIRFGLAASLALLGVWSSARDEARVTEVIAGAETETIDSPFPDAGVATRILAMDAHKRARSLWNLRTQLAYLEKRS